MVAAGIVAGLVALRLRSTFARVVAESEARERVINLFGQHVSPAVVDRLLARPVEPRGERVAPRWLGGLAGTGRRRRLPPPLWSSPLAGLLLFPVHAGKTG
jgi:hypothetical protein